MASLVDRNVFRSLCEARNVRNRYVAERFGIGRTSAPQARSSRTTAFHEIIEMRFTLRGQFQPRFRGSRFHSPQHDPLR